jgi:polysaccharide export outer membrane protein
VEPVVNLKIMNFDIYFLGDIPPHSITVYHEKVNILDAISQAGDLMITGKRKNVLLIRTEGDTKKLVRFDLTNTDLFRSPYFYLRQRDIIYVEPNKFKVINSDNTFVRNLGIFSSLIGIGTLLLAIRNTNL